MNVMQQADQQMIEFLGSAGADRDRVLRQLLLDEALNRAVREKLDTMGGGPGDVGWLLDEALIDLVRTVRERNYPAGKTMGDFLLERIALQWMARLGRDDLKRRQVLDRIAEDAGLRDRVLLKMRGLGCRNGEEEDVYQQGFIRLNQVLVERKYRGGDIKGLFFRICEYLRLNERRKSREFLPEFLPEKGIGDIEEMLERKERVIQLKRWLQRIGEKCRKTLQLWNDGLSMKEIAEAVPYRDHKEAAVARHRCLKKLFKMIDIRE